MSNPYIGSSFDDFLREDGSLETTTAVATMRFADWRSSVTMPDTLLMCEQNKIEEYPGPDPSSHEISELQND